MQYYSINHQFYGPWDTTAESTDNVNHESLQNRYSNMGTAVTSMRSRNARDIQSYACRNQCCMYTSRYCFLHNLCHDRTDSYLIATNLCMPSGEMDAEDLWQNICACQSEAKMQRSCGRRTVHATWRGQGRGPWQQMIKHATSHYLAGSGSMRTMSESSLRASKPITMSHKCASRQPSDVLYKPAAT